MTTLAQRLTTWRYVMNHANLPDGIEMDWLSKWLIVTRATVFTMTATSGLIGGLLAIGTTGVSVNYWYLALGAFRHTRRAGGLLIVGLFLNALLPGLRLPWT
jgi:hypothetical protein